MDIFESLENLNVSEECFDDIMGIVEELLNESNRARKYGQKNLNGDSSTVDIFGTKALKDAAQMNSLKVPTHGVMHYSETEKALKDKEALQTAIKSLEQADSYTARKSLPELKKSARAISRRKSSGENEDVLADNGRGLIKGFRDTKANYKNVMNSFNNHYGYNKLEKEIRDSKKKNN